MAPRIHLHVSSQLAMPGHARQWDGVAKNKALLQAAKELEMWSVRRADKLSVDTLLFLAKEHQSNFKVLAFFGLSNEVLATLADEYLLCLYWKLSARKHHSSTWRPLHHHDTPPNSLLIPFQSMSCSL